MYDLAPFDASDKALLCHTYPLFINRENVTPWQYLRKRVLQVKKLEFDSLTEEKQMDNNISIPNTDCVSRV